MEEQTTPNVPVNCPAEKPVKVKDRSIEELGSVATKAMTPTEIKKYVDHLRDTNVTLETQLKSLREAFMGVQKQKVHQDELLRQVNLAAKTQIQFCKDTIAQAYKTLHYMQPLEDFIGGND